MQFRQTYYFVLLLFHVFHIAPESTHYFEFRLPVIFQKSDYTKKESELRILKDSRE